MILLSLALSFLSFNPQAHAFKSIQDADQYVMKYSPTTGDWDVVNPNSDSPSWFSGGNNFNQDQLFYYGLDKIVFEGKTYPLSGPGLYRVVNAVAYAQNMIVMPSKRSVDDPRKLWFSLLQGINAIHLHGLKHEDMFYHATNDLRGVTRTLTTLAYFEATCGATAAGTMALLEQQLGFSEGSDMRIVRISTNHDLNTYSNGHTIFELRDPNTNKWVLVDEDLGFLFKDATTHATLSAFETWQHFTQNHEVELSPIGKKHYGMATEQPWNGKDLGQLNFAKFANMDLTKMWYKRVFDLLAIDHTACGLQSYWENLYGSLPYSYLQPSVFQSRFYR